MSCLIEGATVASAPCCGGLLSALVSENGPLLGDMTGQSWAVLFLVVKPKLEEEAGEKETAQINGHFGNKWK